MPTHTLSIQFSRRAVLGGAAAVTVSATAIPTVATLSAKAGSTDSDAELLRRISAAKLRWTDFIAAKEISERLHRMASHYMGCPRTTRLSVVDRVKFNEFADKIGYRDAADHTVWLHEQYGEAMDEAFCTPACTRQGLYAKLEFALERAKMGETAAFLGDEFEWLDMVMADFEPLARSSDATLSPL